MRRTYRRKYKQHGKRLLFCMLVFLVIGSIALYMLFELRIRPVMTQVAAAKAKSIAVGVMNDEIDQVLLDGNVQYGDLVTLQKDSMQRVSAVTANILEINRLKAEMAMQIQNRMTEVGEMSVRIPIGTLLSNGILAGRGPDVLIRLTPIGHASVNIADSFTEAGINQTRHEIHLIVTITVYVVLPTSSVVTDVSTDIPVAQSVIVGSVPDSFAHVSGTEETPSDTLMNMLPSGE